MRPKRNTDNPFSAARLRPGAIEFFADADGWLDDCLARLRQNGWWGQIRGPHGSGKSTLLCALAPRLTEAGRRVESFTLHDGQRRLPVAPRQTRSCDHRTQVVIDGFEQLAFVSRWRIKRTCRRGGGGLLITAHRDLGLPDIFVTQPTPELARRVAERLMDGWPPLIAPEDVDRCFAQCRGDLRETLFALYDLFEQRRTCDAGGP